jgi:hypothetical protein
VLLLVVVVSRVDPNYLVILRSQERETLLVIVVVMGSLGTVDCHLILTFRLLICTFYVVVVVVVVLLWLLLWWCCSGGLV